ncbi:unnamed protein product [Fraxinus pennsylvanica]|uniref:Glutamine dumper 2 n=1 Tax=Fraxinus pennsylvanica TaxID=56036 RepID=A0AAD2A087_9LAMI|nr:unnamed protein product [Fraxinus pennsylvanica]
MTSIAGPEGSSQLSRKTLPATIEARENKISMRPTYNTTAIVTAKAGVRIQIWKSPILYLFGGLAIVSGIIAVALIVLACSHRKSSPSDAEEKPLHELQPEMEPKIVVIMAGESNPTYLAKPADF